MTEEAEHVHRFVEKWASEYGLVGACGYDSDYGVNPVDFVLSNKCSCGLTPMGLLKEMISSGDFDIEMRQ